MEGVCVICGAGGAEFEKDLLGEGLDLVWDGVDLLEFWTDELNTFAGMHPDEIA